MIYWHVSRRVTGAGRMANREEHDLRGRNHRTATVPELPSVPSWRVSPSIVPSRESQKTNKNNDIQRFGVSSMHRCCAFCNGTFSPTFAIIAKPAGQPGELLRDQPPDQPGVDVHLAVMHLHQTNSERSRDPVSPGFSAGSWCLSWALAGLGRARAGWGVRSPRRSAGHPRSVQIRRRVVDAVTRRPAPGGAGTFAFRNFGV